MSDVGYTGVANFANTTLGTALKVVASNAAALSGVGGNTVCVQPSIGSPSLALDFVTGSALDSRITFARADASTCATRVNSFGLIETVAANVARFDYDPTTLACKGLLIEESRANLLLRSTDFSNATWNKNGGVTATGKVDGPAGVGTADRIDFSTGGAGIFMRQGVSFTSGTTYAFSIYARSVSGSTTLTLDLGNVSTLSFTLTPTWTRYTGTLTPGATYTWIDISLGAGGGVADLYGAQAEVGAFSTSLIVTTTASLTRAADSALMRGATQFDAWFNAAQGTLVASAEVRAVLLANRSIALLGRSTSATNEVYMQISRSADSRRSLGILESSLQASWVPTGTVTSSKQVVAYALNNSNAAIDGVLQTLDTACVMPTSLTTLYIGNDDSGATNINGWVKSVVYYPTRIADAQLPFLTL